MTKIVPTLLYAAEFSKHLPDLMEVEARVREELQEYVSEDVLSVCRQLVEHFGDGED